MTAAVYRGYSARMEFDAEDRIFVGHIDGIGDLVGFHADSVEGLIRSFHEAVDDYIAACREIGKTPEEPRGGRMPLHLSPEVHAKAAAAARLSGKSVDRWGEDVLDAAADRAPA